MGKLLNFLFGKENNIFDSQGRVLQRLPRQRWDAWQQRYLSDSAYNWKNHSGMKARERRSSSSTTSAH
ncbi:MAG: hypothetical protein IPK68_10720 [Bdellovibrionales bacterium]|nr:hypothetical protein [Bdellovibrionales bacterium]